MLKIVTNFYNQLMGTLLERVTTEDILKLSVPTLEKLVDLVTNSCNSLEFENKLHERGLLYFSVYRLLARDGDRGIQKFARFQFRRHIGKIESCVRILNRCHLCLYIFLKLTVIISCNFQKEVDMAL